METISLVNRIEEGFYVMDTFAVGNKIISGPFSNKLEAYKDKEEWNCADDYYVAYICYQGNDMVILEY